MQQNGTSQNTISLIDALKKEFGKSISDIEKNCIAKDGSNIPLDDQIAVVSHYFQLQGTKFYDFYSQATEILANWFGSVGQTNKNSTLNEAEGLYHMDIFKGLYDIPFPSISNPKFTFIDLFAGIGGFRIAMQNLGGKCVYSSEWDEQAKKTYLANFGDVPFGDITKEYNKSFIPDDFDILCAGFPCQSFSLAGKRKGFDETRGTMFFEVAEILRRKQPKGIFLENVKGLKIHDHGKTFETIKNTLDEVGYVIADDPEIVNAMNFGVPQHRERVYIIGVRKDIAKKFKITKKVVQNSYPKPTDSSKTFADIKEDHEVSVKYYLSTQYIITLKNHKARHEAKGHGFGYEIIRDDQVSNAIVVGGMGRERNLVIDDRLTNFIPITHIKGVVNHEGIRRMTPREWARLQGFPDNFKIVVADASAYKQFGNSVAVPAIQATAKSLLNLLKM
jgi:DNA-cytosine methyltransferase